jgi:hypothetical protein
MQKHGLEIKMKNLLSLTLIILGLCTSMAYADGRDGGGGVGFLCHEHERNRVYLADTYQLVKSGVLANFDSVELPALFLEAAHQLSGPKADYSMADADLTVRFSKLTWQREEPLALLGDDHIAPNQIPANCKKVQLVVQDISTGVLYYNMPLVMQLSSAEYKFLELHETLISLRNQPGADTTPIRGQVASVSDSGDFPQLLKWMTDPNSLLDVNGNHQKSLQILSALPGEYTGEDQLHNPCRVTITKTGNSLTFSSEITFKNGSTRRVTPPAAPIKSLAAEMDAQAKDGSFENCTGSSCSRVSYDTTKSFSTLLGFFQMSATDIDVEVRDGKLDFIHLADTYGDSGQYCWLPGLR